MDDGRKTKDEARWTTDDRPSSLVPRPCAVASVLVTAPTRDLWRLQCAGMLQTNAGEIGTDVKHVEASPVEWCRNRMALLFLESDRDWHVMVDDDVEIPAGGLQRLIGVADAERAPIVAAPVPIVTRGHLVSNILVSTPTGTGWLELANLTNLREPFPCEAAGTGCLVIHRRVYEALHYPWFDTRQDGQTFRLGEDLYFCRQARAAGFSIWCVPQVLCEHYKIRGLLEGAGLRTNDETEI